MSLLLSERASYIPCYPETKMIDFKSSAKMGNYSVFPVRKELRLVFGVTYQNISLSHHMSGHSLNYPSNRGVCIATVYV